MTYVIDGRVGVNLSETVAGTGTNSNQGDAFLLGQIVEAQSGQQYMRVHASASISQYAAVGIDEDFEAAPLTKAMADDGWFIGFAQVAAADNDFLWVAVAGTDINCRLGANCAADVSLYTSATAGVLDDDATSQTKIDGVVSVTTIGGAIAAGEVIATAPRSSSF